MTRILNKIDSIVEDPHHFLESCEGYPYYHQRVGNYRIIHDLNDRDRIIEVLKIGLRKNVYDR
ncbi:type II toxin-antitoxin system RelE/ParE family toxin [Methanospirillum purgamenti]|uniref:Type II toxin-antitoxin system RelE/ParE family toxin n=1 Tax=Methanospirillum hungatei TaxID=2203 RepID=A0A8F5VPN6_METHU|nr:type II toxin-antitoxin system RelE/ParE family toxin [Methanospirillum hungatei]